ncbi:MULTISPECIES: phenol hydroxylase subunit P4 [Alcaligenaceae]|uniref:Phenol 2-monooxygenase P4 subunit n=2 Tax=Alcaligenaceae TaxID=506 RepID=A0A366H2W5_9BURK|nr:MULTISPECIES: phenol hydroxylase subunit P4 [Alcaligenaceae]MCI2810650.1 phenol hydroxylase subunit P4 [Eoetvoesiella caeni]NYT56566.1 phenol hydroxylase subunit P4 [Eoetvoesiella caeni]RBP36273.1 phenol 2-monooxygenase P4 subunit [Eoetvoesiella caeni]RIY38874.1 phenol hydroxylase [Neopusillimonas maritima]
MSVKALKPYEFPARDARANFPHPLLFLGWEDHLLFCSPVAMPMPSDMLFGDLVEKVLPGVYGMHPDFSKIDWDHVQWFKSGQQWMPDPAKSLEANGLGHKAVIRFRTSGLTGIGGSCS